LASGKVLTQITNHKKSVRALKIHPSEYTFVSGSADNIKVFKCPENSFLRNFSGHNSIVNALAINQDNVLVSAADDGSIKFWDWKTAHNFQSLETQVQPGSLDSEAGIFALAFDKSGSRLITCEADKTIKIYKEDADATEETHPLDWQPSRKRKRF
jgi:pleiotropic regulator 1